MRHFNRFLLAAAVLFTVTTAFAADEDVPSIKTTMNRQRILIGDRIRYKAEISSRLNLEFEFPKFKDNKIDECEIKDAGREIKSSLFGRSYIFWLDITSYYIGKRKIPPIEIKYREKGEGNWKTLKTSEMTFTVESVLPRNVRLQDIRDVKGPIYPFSFLRLVIWVISACLVLWLSVKVLRKLIKKKPPKLPYELAVEALEAARAEFSSTGDIKMYYVNISDAVRKYIEVVFKLRAPEMTTQEFLSSIGKSWKISVEYRELLKVFMEACDLVKFARHKPSKEEADSVFTAAKKFIEETKGEYVPV